MARNTSVTLGEHFSQFVDEQIKDGRFSNVSEVVRAGLRLLEDSETKQRALRAALLAGEASGPAVPLDWDEFLARKRAAHRDVTEVVPFLAVADMRASLAFYVDGLGFSEEARWVDEGVLRWCRLRLGGASLMLQQFRTSGHDARRFASNKGEGVVLCFFCADAVAFYRAVCEQGIAATEPQVGNAMWVTELIDPDGYRLLFESPTDVPEETRLSRIP